MLLLVILSHRAGELCKSGVYWPVFQSAAAYKVTVTWFLIVRVYNS